MSKRLKRGCWERCEGTLSRAVRISDFRLCEFGEFMSSQDKILKCVRSLMLALLCCSPAFAQQQGDLQRRTSETGRRENGVEQIPELTKQNLDRVAASAIEIRSVLVKDAGLMVELKRWVAKEASDNGQIVEDASLTNQAIFERLQQDVAFRSVATRLLQRYGYLLPTAIPDSDYAKEKELVLKERARRLVQIESQEDSEAIRPENNGRDFERTGTCDPRRDENCLRQSPTDRRLSTRKPDGMSAPETNPQEAEPEQPALSGTSRILRAEGSSQATDSLDNALGVGASPNFELTSNPADRDNNQTPGSATFSRGAVDGLPMARNTPSSSRERGGSSDALIKKNEVESLPQTNYPRGLVRDEDVTSVRMVHRANPYANIPSLYDMYVQASERQRPNDRFGLAVFRNNVNDPRSIPMDLPAGPDYVIGPGDGLEIDLWGGVSQRFLRVVDREGRLSLPEVGPLLVSGRSLGEVQQAVQQVLRTQYRDVSADVSLSKLRTVRVYVVGDVAEPGAYDISSLSTPLNALFAAGGVTGRGSLRAIKHYRGKQLVQEVDAYDLLLHGIRSDLERLENGDTLLVPPMGPQVTVDGMVRRPAVYELAKETSLADALELAGGILPTAALRHIEVQRIEAHQKRTMLTLDLTSDDAQEVEKQLQAFQIRDGDQVHIFPIASYNEDAIYLQGHVLRPGRYSYKQGMKLTDLILSYGDMLPEPASHYAEIVRLNPPDFHPSVESFDISAALDNPASAPVLKPLDTVRIFSRFDFEAPPQVWVGGEVRAPGQYRTSGQAHLRDAVYLAGGITPDADLDSAQLFRTQADGTMKILSVDLREALAGNPVDNVILQTRDRVIIHKSLARVEAPTVDIRGEVAKPGRYPLTANMRVEDLVRVAGGLERSAYADNADLTRFVAGGGANEHLDIKLATALSGEVNDNIPLRNGDVLAIRQIPQWNDLSASVTVRGEVQHPATYGIEPGERLSSLLARCGGFTPEGFPYGAVLIRQEVRELELRSHLELVTRLKNEQTYLKAMPEADADQKNAKLTAIAQTDTALQQLEATAPVGRVVIHIPSDLRRLPKTAGDISLRAGDVLIIPKKTNYVVVSGQVFNPTAVSYLPGKSAKWYLSQSGGLTQIADKSAVFVVRADGSVLSAKNNSGLWSGDPMNAVLKPGDSIVVPEKAPKIAPRNWT